MTLYPALLIKIQAQELISSSGFLKYDSAFTELNGHPFYPLISFEKLGMPGCSERPEMKNRKTWIGRKLYSEHLLQVDSTMYSLIIDPAVCFTVGDESATSVMLYENTRGIRFSGHLHNKLIFSSEIYETQSILSGYLEHFTDSFGVVPGLMRAKKFKEHGRDFAHAYGSIAWVPGRHFNILFARDKQHFGYGHRSVFLSESAPASTFIRATAAFGSWTYSFNLTSLQNLPLKNVLNAPQSSLGGFQNKYASFIVLSKKISDRVEVSLFESVIWAPHSDRYNSIHVRYFNPIPLSKTLWYGLNDRNNTSVGLQLAARLPFDLLFYSQYLLDDTEKPLKTAFQAGLKYHKKIFKEEIFARCEFNTVGAYTFSHSDPLQSYSHYHHPLSHPFGANYREAMAEMMYRKNRLIFHNMISFVYGGADTQYESNGQNIYSDPGFANWNGSLFPKLTTNISSVLFLEMRLHYLMNCKSGLNAFLSFTHRNAKKTPFPGVTNEVHFGVSTNLRTHSKHLSWL